MPGSRSIDPDPPTDTLSGPTEPAIPPATPAGVDLHRVSRHATVRALWLIGGVAALVLGVVGIFLPLLPTTPFVLLAGFCFSRGSQRWDDWLLNHPRLGPPVRDWRQHRAVPVRAKQLATVMMTASSLWAWWAIPSAWRWAPAISCALVATWLWRLPTRQRQA